MLRTFVIAIGLFAAMTVSASAENLYVQGRGAALLASPAFNAQRMTPVQTGSEVTVVEQRGLWLKVSYAGRAGWLPKLLLSTRPPVVATTVFTGDRKIVEENARRRASAATTAGATRGFTADDRRRMGADIQLGLRQLEKVEQKSVEPQAAIEFINAGVAQ